MGLSKLLDQRHQIRADRRALQLRAVRRLVGEKTHSKLERCDRCGCTLKRRKAKSLHGTDCWHGQASLPGVTIGARMASALAGRLSPCLRYSQGTQILTRSCHDASQAARKRGIPAALWTPARVAARRRTQAQMPRCRRSAPNRTPRETAYGLPRCFATSLAPVPAIFTAATSRASVMFHFPHYHRTSCG